MNHWHKPEHLHCSLPKQSYTRYQHRASESSRFCEKGEAQICPFIPVALEKLLCSKFLMLSQWGLGSSYAPTQVLMVFPKSLFMASTEDK